MTKNVSTIIGELADREAIRDCLYRLCRGTDRIDVDLMLSALWPEATDEHGNFTATSAQGYIDHALPILQAMDQTKHVLTNILIDIKFDRAHVESSVQVFHRLRKPDGTPYDHISSGRYLDHMERRDGEWRIIRRVVVRDWFLEFPVSGDWQDGDMPKTLKYGKNGPLTLGARKPHDRSYEVLGHK